MSGMEVLPVAKGIGSILGGIGAVKGIFSSGGDAPKTPEILPPTPMPTPDDAASRAAKRKSIAAQQQRQGRASTILTEAATDTLG